MTRAVAITGFVVSCAFLAYVLTKNPFAAPFAAGLALIFLGVVGWLEERRR